MGTCCCYANEEMSSSLFMSDSQWEIARSTKGRFDYVVIGSSFCAIGFVLQVLKNNPNAKIMIIERGDHEDSNNYSPFDRKSKEKESRTYDWVISEDTKNGEYIKEVCGMNNVFGGRSLFWKGWSPEPTVEEMEEWPEELIQNVLKYFSDAKKLLSVQPINEITEENGGNKISFGSLQNIIHRALESTPTDIEAIKKINHAPLAVVPVQNCRYGDYQKYSVLQQLMDILKTKKEVKAILKCEVKRIQRENKKAKLLETTKGDFILGGAKLILAMSTLPSTTLILNSFQPPCSLSNIGKRFTAHFTTYIYARIPYTSMSSDLNAAAIYVGGQNETFHIQLTAVFVKGPKLNDDFETMRNLLKTPSEKQLQSCNDHIVFTCACLGQIDHKNEKNWVSLNDQEEDITRNITVQIITNNKDNDLWDTMDNSSFKMLEILADTLPPPATAGRTRIEYWNSVDERWQSNRPTRKQIRSETVVHPASTMWIGNTDSDPVNHDYQFRGVDNVYLTGGSLWPTGTSWNPTCAMTAMAMNLGDNLSQCTLSKL